MMGSGFGEGIVKGLVTIGIIIGAAIALAIFGLWHLGAWVFAHVRWV